MREFIKKNHRGAMITAIMGGETPEELIAQCRGADYDGADGICIDVSYLRPEFRKREAFKRVIDSCPTLPFMFYFYRSDYHKQCATDEERQEILMEAALGGAHIIDVMGDLYDPSPRENTHNPEAIQKQMALIERFHEAGSQVVMSSHMSNEFLTTEEVLQQLRDFEKRGADVVKCVTRADSEAEVLEAIKTSMTLHRELEKPFIYLINGKYFKLHRFLGPCLGTDIVFAVHRYDMRFPMSQPTVKAMRAVFDSMRFHVDDVK